MKMEYKIESVLGWFSNGRRIVKTKRTINEVRYEIMKFSGHNFVFEIIRFEKIIYASKHIQTC